MWLGSALEQQAASRAARRLYRRELGVGVGRRGARTAVNFIDRVPAINHTVRSDGSGTIRFGNPSWMGNAYGNTGMEFFEGFHGGSDVITFYDLPDAREAVSLLDKMRRDR